MMFVSLIEHVNAPFNCKLAVPLFWVRSVLAVTRLLPMTWLSVIVQPRTVTDPVPLAITCPLQQN